jgi:tetratricopeptide (TPR) repeat protein
MDNNLRNRLDASVMAIRENGLPLIDLVNIAEQLVQANEQDQARGLYQQWLDQSITIPQPLAYVAYFNLGILLGDAGDLSSAEDAYRNAIRLNPQFAGAYLNLGTLLISNQRLHATYILWRAAANAAIRAQPNDDKLLMLAQSQLRQLTQQVGIDPGPDETSLDPVAIEQKRVRLARFDALDSGMIFALWLGPALMSPSRIQALQAIFRDSARPVCFITDATLHEWEHPDYPFHPAFQYLSEVHRADYLRCYLMHHYGGGYTDIKPVLRSWTPHFEKLRSSEQLALGYPEISATAVAQLPGAIGDQLRANYAEVIGYCSMIFRRQSVVTSEWIEETNAKLNSVLPELRAHPAQAPMDQKGVQLPSGEASQYPLQWTELGGNIFHPVILKYRHLVIKETGIVPQLFDYR